MGKLQCPDTDTDSDTDADTDPDTDADIDRVVVGTWAWAWWWVTDVQKIALGIRVTIIASVLIRIYGINLLLFH